MTENVQNSGNENTVAKLESCCGNPGNCPVDYRQCPYGGVPPDDVRYVLLPVTPNDEMLLDMAVVKSWEIDDEEGGCTERDLAYEGFENLIKHGIPVPASAFLNGKMQDASVLTKTVDVFFSDIKQCAVDPTGLFDPMEKDDWQKLGELRSVLELEETTIPFTVLQVAIARIKRLTNERDQALLNSFTLPPAL